MLVKRRQMVLVNYDVICTEMDINLTVDYPGTSARSLGVSMTAGQTARLIKALQRGLAKFPRRKSRRKKA